MTTKKIDLKTIFYYILNIVTMNTTYIDLLPDDVIDKIYKEVHTRNMNEILWDIETAKSDIESTIVSKRRWKRRFTNVLRELSQ